MSLAFMATSHFLCYCGRLLVRRLEYTAESKVDYKQLEEAVELLGPGTQQFQENVSIESYDGLLALL